MSYYIYYMYCMIEVCLHFYLYVYIYMYAYLLFCLHIYKVYVNICFTLVVAAVVVWVFWWQAKQTGSLHTLHDSFEIMMGKSQD